MRPLIAWAVFFLSLFLFLLSSRQGNGAELRLTDRSGRTVYVLKAGTVVRDSSGRTVARIARQFGSRNLVVRDTRGRTIGRIKVGK